MLNLTAMLLKSRRIHDDTIAPQALDSLSHACPQVVLPGLLVGVRTRDSSFIMTAVRCKATRAAKV